MEVIDLTDDAHDNNLNYLLVVESKGQDKSTLVKPIGIEYSIDVVDLLDGEAEEEEEENRTSQDAPAFLTTSSASLLIHHPTLLSSSSSLSFCDDNGEKINGDGAWGLRKVGITTNVQGGRVGSNTGAAKNVAIHAASSNQRQSSNPQEQPTCKASDNNIIDISSDESEAETKTAGVRKIGNNQSAHLKKTARVVKKSDRSALTTDSHLAGNDHLLGLVGAHAQQVSSNNDASRTQTFLPIFTNDSDSTMQKVRQEPAAYTLQQEIACVKRKRTRGRRLKRKDCSTSIGGGSHHPPLQQQSECQGNKNDRNPMAFSHTTGRVSQLEFDARPIAKRAKSNSDNWKGCVPEKGPEKPCEIVDIASDESEARIKTGSIRKLGNNQRSPLKDTASVVNKSDRFALIMGSLAGVDHQPYAHKLSCNDESKTQTSVLPIFTNDSHSTMQKVKQEPAAILQQEIARAKRKRTRGRRPKRKDGSTSIGGGAHPPPLQRQSECQGNNNDLNPIAFSNTTGLASQLEFDATPMAKHAQRIPEKHSEIMDIASDESEARIKIGSIRKIGSNQRSPLKDTVSVVNKSDRFALIMGSLAVVDHQPYAHKLSCNDEATTQTSVLPTFTNDSDSTMQKVKQEPAAILQQETAHVKRKRTRGRRPQRKDCSTSIGSDAHLPPLQQQSACERNTNNHNPMAISNKKGRVSQLEFDATPMAKHAQCIPEKHSEIMDIASDESEARIKTGRIRKIGSNQSSPLNEPASDVNKSDRFALIMGSLAGVDHQPHAQILSGDDESKTQTSVLPIFTNDSDSTMQKIKQEPATLQQETARIKPKRARGRRPKRKDCSTSIGSGAHLPPLQQQSECERNKNDHNPMAFSRTTGRVSQLESDATPMAEHAESDSDTCKGCIPDQGPEKPSEMIDIASDESDALTKTGSIWKICSNQSSHLKEPALVVNKSDRSPLTTVSLTGNDHLLDLGAHAHKLSGDDLSKTQTFRDIFTYDSDSTMQRVEQEPATLQHDSVQGKRARGRGLKRWDCSTSIGASAHYPPLQRQSECQRNTNDHNPMASSNDEGRVSQLELDATPMAKRAKSDSDIWKGCIPEKGTERANQLSDSKREYDFTPERKFDGVRCQENAKHSHSIQKEKEPHNVGTSVRGALHRETTNPNVNELDHARETFQCERLDIRKETSVLLGQKSKPRISTCESLDELDDTRLLTKKRERASDRKFVSDEPRCKCSCVHVQEEQRLSGMSRKRSVVLKRPASRKCVGESGLDMKIKKIKRQATEEKESFTAPAASAGPNFILIDDSSDDEHESARRHTRNQGRGTTRMNKSSDQKVFLLPHKERVLDKKFRPGADFNFDKSMKEALEDQEALLRQAAASVHLHEEFLRSMRRPKHPLDCPIFTRAVDPTKLHKDHWKWPCAYARLGLPRHASDSIVRQQYRKHALRYHPDKCRLEDASSRFQAVTEAFNKIKSP